MGDRLSEHPQTVLAITNLLYTEAPYLWPSSEEKQSRLNWLEVAFEGNTAYEFDEQIRDLLPLVREWWATKPSERTGNPVYAAPSVIIIYRKDQEWPLGPVIPRRGEASPLYDLVLAAQPFRATQPAAAKVKTVLAPLARALAPGGNMVVVQSTGKDPGMEIIRTLWPDEDPFRTPRFDLLRELAPSSARPIRTSGSSPTRTPARSFAMSCNCSRKRSRATLARRRCWRPGTPPPTWPRRTTTACATP